MNTTPILVIIFNRPDFAQRIYDVLNELKPTKLYIISDGGRNEKEKKEVKLSREIFNTINWNCQVFYNYSDENLGLRNRISGGISWAFESEDKLIILEDDCIPHLDFFKFCSELLVKYKDDERIMTLNGCNMNSSISEESKESYFFSKYTNSWGWATWKRAWALYDSNLEGLDNFNLFKRALYNLPFRFRSTIYWKYKLNEVKQSRINSWAFRWMFSLWINNGLAIVPKTNLIQNIGNDERSSNTKGNLHFINIKTASLNIKKMNHPKNILANLKYDQWLENFIYSKSIKYRLIWLFKKSTFQI